MELTTQIKSTIKKYALKEKPDEVCGLIISSGNFVSIYPCKNISSNKKVRFELSPLDYVRALDDGGNKVLGIFHSQENKNLSVLDVLNSMGHKIYSVVYSWKYDEFYEITNQHVKYKQYIGKEFEIGKNDCFSIIRDFYKKEYNININDYFRDDKWYKKNPNIIKENFEKEGGIEVKFEDIKEGDVIIFSFGHFAIYLGENLILHAPRDKYSNIEYLNDSYKNRISLILRHKSKIN